MLAVFSRRHLLAGHGPLDQLLVLWRGHLDQCISLYAFVQACANKAVKVIAQCVGAGKVTIDLRFRFACDGGGFRCKLWWPAFTRAATD